MDCGDGNRFDEAREIHSMLSLMDPSCKEGSFWYLMPLSWFKRWEVYTYYDLIKEDPINARSIIAEAEQNGDERPHPGIIDYTEIIDMTDDNILMDTKNTWQNYQLKKHLVEGRDYTLVTLEIVRYLKDRYGTEGGNYKDFCRQARKQENGEIIVELFFREMQLLAFPIEAKFKRRDPWKVYIPSTDTVEDLEKKITRGINQFFKEAQQDIKVDKFRLWRCNLGTSENDVSKIVMWDHHMK